jgi:lipopolysaccharide export LptBFGC system permease protein LptF
VDTDTGLLTINNFFQDYDVVRDITTTGVCKGSPFDSNNPVPSNNLFSFIRPIAEESAYTSKLFVNGVEVTSDSDYKISNFKFGIKKSSIKVGYKYNFLFNITYKSVTYYKTITIEGNELYEVDKYQNNTNYYVDIDKVKTNSIVINPTNSDIYLPNDVTFHLNPTNSQATADKNSFNLKYKIEENHTVGEISWSNLENTTGNNKI